MSDRTLVHYTELDSWTEGEDGEEVELIGGCYLDDQYNMYDIALESFILNEEELTEVNKNITQRSAA